MDVNLRFRVTQTYASRAGFVGGVPTFYTAIYPDSTVFGSLVVAASAADWRDIPVPALGRTDPVDFIDRVVAVMRYARRWGYEAGFPTFLQGIAHNDTVYGAMLFKKGSITIESDDAFFTGIADDDIGELFRAAQRFATSRGFVGGFPTFAVKRYGEKAADGHEYSVVMREVALLPASGVQFVDVARSDLDSPTLLDPAQHVRSMQHRAVVLGGVGAVPTFFEALAGGFVCGTLLIDGVGAEWRDVAIDDLGNVDRADQAARFRATQGYADRNGFVGGFPTFMESTRPGHTSKGDPRDVPVHGTVLVKNSVAEKRDVLAGDLANPRDDDGPARFRATQDFAVHRVAAVGGFPNFNQLPIGPNHENVYGTILLRHVVFRDVPYQELFTDDVIRGAIRAHWLQLGGPSGLLGLPLTEQLPCMDGVGCYNVFDGGAVYYSPATGAWEVHGAIWARWVALGAETSYLGYPQSDEAGLSDPLTGKALRHSRFQRGSIFWSDGTVFEVADVVTKHLPVLTAQGSPLGGSVDLTLRSDGAYTLAIHMHASGLDSFDFSVRATLATPHGLMLAEQAGGHVQGTLGAGSRNYDRIFQGYNRSIREYWNDVKDPAARLMVAKDYSATGVVGFVLDVSKGIVDAAAAGVGLGVGAVIGLGSDLGALFPSLGLGETFGVLDGIVVFAFGGGLATAIVQGIAVGAITDAAIASRPLTDDERTFVHDKVFGDGLALDDIRVTNLCRPDGRAFTLPGIDGKTYVNMGVDRGDYTKYMRPGRAPPDVPGQLLIHELTHAWQIQHSDFEPMFICIATISGADDLMGADVYTAGPAGPDWTKFRVEQQAMIVEDWFARGPGGPDARSGEDDPYFRYIRDNIRKGNG